MNLSRIFWGGMLITGGAVLLGDTAGWWDGGDVVSRWWPLVIIAAAGISMLSRPRRYLGPTFLAAIGVILLVDRLDIVAIQPGVIWASALVIVGVLVMVGRTTRSGADESRVAAFSAFGGTEVASHSLHFEGGSIGAIFGGTELDLRDANSSRAPASTCSQPSEAPRSRSPRAGRW